MDNAQIANKKAIVSPMMLGYSGAAITAYAKRARDLQTATHAKLKASELLLSVGAVKCPVPFAAHFTREEFAQDVPLRLPDGRSHDSCRAE